jgi:GT2 family glycosyltransferase
MSVPVPELSVVVLSWNTQDLLRACLQALANDPPAQAREILVVDNGSSDGSADMVAREFPTVMLLRNTENLGYAEGNNVGARAATGKFLCLLNSDTEVRPGALDRLLEFLQSHADYAAVGPKLLNVDGSVQRAWRARRAGPRPLSSTNKP